jgi:protein-S-isoprenylcysteine O-methyltransferase Ste14
MQRIARLRVPIGFATAIVAILLAQPTPRSWWAGVAVAALGELIRVWAAGHIEKGREITQSGPYRFVRHPLYLGSTLLGVGFVIAARHVGVALLTAAYLGVTLTAAARAEEAHLDDKFAGAYSDYRSGGMPPDEPKAFSWARVAGNREYHAAAGLVAVFLFLYFRL